MIRPAVALLRSLREFFEREMFGTLSFDGVKILRCGKGSGQEEDDEREMLQVSFRAGNASRRITMLGSADAPPLGQISLTSADDGEAISGPIQPETFQRIKARLAA